MKKAFLLIFLLALSFAVYADQGAKKDLLVGPMANLWCDDLTPVLGEDSSQIQDGFVIFNFDDDYEILMATVKLKGAEPYTEYPVRLLQKGGSDCFIVDAVLYTNGQGNGVAHMEELGTADGAQIFINTDYAPDGSPRWRATDIFWY